MYKKMLMKQKILKVVKFRGKLRLLEQLLHHFKFMSITKRPDYTNRYNKFDKILLNLM